MAPQSRPRYFIHGNGTGKTCAPKGFLADSIPGHDNFFWPAECYSIEAFVDYFAQKVPANAIVLAHSLGGHIALNVALVRPDISVVACGMVPLKGLSDMGTLMTPVPEFTAFQNPQRNEDDLEAYAQISALGNRSVLDKLVAVSRAQDNIFNVQLFTQGITNYDWNEIEKIQKLGNRFLLVLSPHERVYNFALASELSVNSLVLNYPGHTPWLLESNWFETIEEEVLAKLLPVNSEAKSVQTRQFN